MGEILRLPLVGDERLERRVREYREAQRVVEENRRDGGKAARMMQGMLEILREQARKSLLEILDP